MAKGPGCPDKEREMDESTVLVLPSQQIEQEGLGTWSLSDSRRVTKSFKCLTFLYTPPLINEGTELFTGAEDSLHGR